MRQGGEGLGGQHHHEGWQALSGDGIHGGLRAEKRHGPRAGAGSLHHGGGTATPPGGDCPQMPGADRPGADVTRRRNGF